MASTYGTPAESSIRAAKREARLEELTELEHRLLGCLRIRGLLDMQRDDLQKQLDAVMREIAELMR